MDTLADRGVHECLPCSPQRVEDLKREQAQLRHAVRTVIQQLVDGDELIRKLYHMRSGDGSTILSSREWERVRLREARDSHESDSAASERSAT